MGVTDTTRLGHDPSRVVATAVRLKPTPGMAFSQSHVREYRLQVGAVLGVQREER
jgi:hypothetical protein